MLARQKPGSAKGVTFITIEDETGVANLVLWAKRSGGWCCRWIEVFGDVILAVIEAQKDVTLAEFADLLQREYSASFAISTIWRYPVEKAFAKLKAILREAAACTFDDLISAIRDALPAFSPSECANYFTTCGYEPE